jgi:hypothetical protein
MLRSGFRVRLTLRGFETYFWSHTQKPDWVRVARAKEGMDDGADNRRSE